MFLISKFNSIFRIHFQLQCYRQRFVSQTIDQWRCCASHHGTLGSCYCLDSCTSLRLEPLRSRRQHDRLRYWLPFTRLQEPFIHHGIQFLRLHSSIVDHHLLVLVHRASKFERKSSSSHTIHMNTYPFISFWFNRLSQLTKRTCASKLKKWMLHHCGRLKLKQPQLNANWPKLPSWPFHCGSWHGPHIWLSTSLESSNWEPSAHWTPSGDHFSPRLTLSTIQSSTVSAIQNIVLLSSRHSHA